MTIGFFVKSNNDILDTKKELDVVKTTQQSSLDEISQLKTTQQSNLDDISQLKTTQSQLLAAQDETITTQTDIARDTAALETWRNYVDIQAASQVVYPTKALSPAYTNDGSYVQVRDTFNSSKFVDLNPKDYWRHRSPTEFPFYDVQNRTADGNRGTLVLEPFYKPAVRYELKPSSHINDLTLYNDTGDGGKTLSELELVYLTGIFGNPNDETSSIGDGGDNLFSSEHIDPGSFPFINVFVYDDDINNTTKISYGVSAVGQFPLDNNRGDGRNSADRTDIDNKTIPVTVYCSPSLDTMWSDGTPRNYSSTTRTWDTSANNKFLEFRDIKFVENNFNVSKDILTLPFDIRESELNGRRHPYLVYTPVKIDDEDPPDGITMADFSSLFSSYKIKTIAIAPRVNFGFFYQGDIYSGGYKFNRESLQTIDLTHNGRIEYPGSSEDSPIYNINYDNDTSTTIIKPNEINAVTYVQQEDKSDTKINYFPIRSNKRLFDENSNVTSKSGPVYDSVLDIVTKSTNRNLFIYGDDNIISGYSDTLTNIVTDPDTGKRYLALDTSNESELDRLAIRVNGTDIYFEMLVVNEEEGFPLIQQSLDNLSPVIQFTYLKDLTTGNTYNFDIVSDLPGAEFWGITQGTIYYIEIPTDINVSVYTSSLGLFDIVYNLVQLDQDKGIIDIGKSLPAFPVNPTPQGVTDTLLSNLNPQVVHEQYPVYIVYDEDYKNYLSSNLTSSFRSVNMDGLTSITGNNIEGWLHLDNAETQTMNTLQLSSFFKVIKDPSDNSSNVIGHNETIYPISTGLLTLLINSGNYPVSNSLSNTFVAGAYNFNMIPYFSFKDYLWHPAVEALLPSDLKTLYSDKNNPEHVFARLNAGRDYPIFGEKIDSIDTLELIVRFSWRVYGPEGAKLLTDETGPTILYFSFVESEGLNTSNDVKNLTTAEANAYAFGTYTDEFDVEQPRFFAQLYSAEGNPPVSHSNTFSFLTNYTSGQLNTLNNIGKLDLVWHYPYIFFINCFLLEHMRTSKDKFSHNRIAPIMKFLPAYTESYHNHQWEDIPSLYDRFRASLISLDDGQ